MMGEKNGKWFTRLLWKWNSTFCYFTTYEPIQSKNRANNYRNCSAFPFLKVWKLCWHVLNIFRISLPTNCPCSFCVCPYRDWNDVRFHAFYVQWRKAFMFAWLIRSLNWVILRWNSFVSSFDGFRSQKKMYFCAQARNHKPKTARLKSWKLKSVLHSIDVGILFYFQNSIRVAVRFLPLFECKIIIKLL